MKEFKDKKVNRILEIFEKLKEGEGVKKKEIAKKFNVDEKTIQRDINDIRAYFSNETSHNLSVEYRRDKKAYYLNQLDSLKLDKKDVLTICKILLESRAFCKTEMDDLIKSIVHIVNEKDRKFINELIGNEALYFAQLSHKEKLIEKIWNLSEFVRCKEILEIEYKKTNGDLVKRRIKPVSIIFSEYYFYLIAYFDNSKYDIPIVYRIDRIFTYKGVNKKFTIEESKRFQDGEFRKRIQFMYSGELMRVKFEFTGPSLEAVLDKLPTSRIIESGEDKHIIEAEVYGKGIKMWLLSQGSNIKVLSPKDFADEIIEEIKKLHEIYEINKVT